MKMSNYQLKIEHGVDMCYVAIYEDNIWVDQYAGLLEREGELVERAKEYVEWLKVNGQIIGTIYQDSEREIIRRVRGEKDTLLLKYKDQYVCEVLSWPDQNERKSYQEAFQKLLNYNEVVSINKTKVIEL
jgi:hypothetical protein